MPPQAASHQTELVTEPAHLPVRFAHERAQVLKLRATPLEVECQPPQECFISHQQSLTHRQGPRCAIWHGLAAATLYPRWRHSRTAAGRSFVERKPVAKRVDLALHRDDDLAPATACGLGDLELVAQAVEELRPSHELVVFAARRPQYSARARCLAGASLGSLGHWRRDRVPRDFASGAEAAASGAVFIADDRVLRPAIGAVHIRQAAGPRESHATG